MEENRRTCRLLVIAMLACTSSLRAQTVEPRDTVVLTSGKELHGRVIRMDEKEVVLRTGSTDRSIRRQQVRSVDCVTVKHRQFMDIWQNTSPSDVKALLELALVANNAGLPHEARLMQWYAALQQPDNATIHAMLGNREQNGRFLVEIDGKWVPFEKADALGTDFDDAWRVRSEHFAIRCAAGLRSGLDTLMDLERLYWTMHDLFGAVLELPELVETVDVRLYRSREQMPSLGTHVGAYFSTDEAALYTCMADGKPFALMHEATHALLHYLFVRTARTRGTLPAWLDEGWAEYMRGRLPLSQPGKPQLLAHSEAPEHVQAMATADRGDLYGVHRILNFKSSDFSASTHQQLKYAQAWALFRFLFESQDAALREHFDQYLRDAVRGRGQASTFRRLFAADEQRLDTEPWR